MDIITIFLRRMRKNNSTIVVVDRFSKVAHFIVVNSMNSSSEVAQIFIGDIVRLLGVPRKIISDRVSNLISKFWKELFIGLE